MGRDLAARAAELSLPDPVVFGLLPGGLLVAAEIVKTLNAPLRPLVVVEVAAPGIKGLFTGAVTEDGHYWEDPNNAEFRGVSPLDMDSVIFDASKEVREMIARIKPALAPGELRGRSVLLVGDGLEGEIALRVGCAYLAKHDPASLTVVTPACNLRTVDSIERFGARRISLVRPLDYYTDEPQYEERDTELQRAADKLLSLLRDESEGKKPPPANGPGLTGVL
jgi:putative phosphoribosyl transferase